MEKMRTTGQGEIDLQKFFSGGFSVYLILTFKPSVTLNISKQQYCK